ncbi:isochorismate synthase [Owenweeksia hongkongensis]|uniref:isochorismate synthase n=1 Tax=Owenweeksia hongkongensis TaxID=253245 RepID=UPI003A8E0FF6
MMQKLFISLPGSSGYKIYTSDSGGDFAFRFSSFEGHEEVNLKMNQTDDESFTSENFGGQHFNIPTHKEYVKLVENTVAHIRKNDLGKIVMSRPQRFDKVIEPVLVFKKLVEVYPKACVYLFTHPEVGTWMGATPETLLSKKGDVLKTMSLAGTQKKGEEDKFTGKEKVEQALVTDYITEILNAENGVEGVKAEGPIIAEAGNIVHLKTAIEATVQGSFNLSTLIKKLHPTPAVAGFPKKEALEFIKKNEQYKRSFYAGYFGLNQGTEAHYFVNLRCMQVFHDSVVLYAGGGITKDSNPQAEWEETENKMQTLLRVLD